MLQRFSESMSANRRLFLEIDSGPIISPKIPSSSEEVAIRRRVIMIA